MDEHDYVDYGIWKMIDNNIKNELKKNKLYLFLGLL